MKIVVEGERKYENDVLRKGRDKVEEQERWKERNVEQRMKQKSVRKKVRKRYTETEPVRRSGKETQKGREKDIENMREGKDKQRRKEKELERSRKVKRERKILKI